MINRIEAYSKTTNFQWIVLLVALHESLQVFPVTLLKKGVILRVQSGTLELGETGVVQGVPSIEAWAWIQKKADFGCSCIVGILNNFLTKNENKWSVSHVVTFRYRSQTRGANPEITERWKSVKPVNFGRVLAPVDRDKIIKKIWNLQYIFEVKWNLSKLILS